jgi:hypothetical protein
MALSEDQRALLRLLLTGDTYEQVAGVLGIGPDEVRSRAHEASSALEEASDREFSPEVVRKRLEALEGVSDVAAPSPPPRASVGASRLAGRPWALWLALAAAAVVAIVVILVAVGGGGDGGDGTTTATRGDQEDVVPIKLTSVGGSKATGMISVVRVADQPAVDLAVEGLEPSGPGESYVLWFAGSGGRSLPVAFRGVGPDGKLTGRTPIPTAAEGLLPSFTTAVLTLARQREAAAAVQQAAHSATLPQVVGTPVMRGPLR